MSGGEDGRRGEESGGGDKTERVKWIRGPGVKIKVHQRDDKQKGETGDRTQKPGLTQKK